MDALKSSPAFQQCLALAARGVSFEETKHWTAAMRIAALELFAEAEEKERQKLRK